MGFFDKVTGIFNPKNDDYEEGYDEFDGEFDGDNNYQEEGFAQPQQPQQRQTAGRGMAAMSANGIEMKVVKPDKYDSAIAKKIADHLLSKRTVVLNLESTNKEHSRRLIDFLSGVAYSINGYIQQVATNTVIIVPENVDLSGEQAQETRMQDDTDLI